MAKSEISFSCAKLCIWTASNPTTIYVAFLLRFSLSKQFVVLHMPACGDASNQICRPHHHRGSRVILLARSLVLCYRK